jgi:uncharacterized protein YndB with AHSA1/START domain
VRVESSADIDVRPADLFALAADLRNLPAWWIEHLSAEVEVPGRRLRDSVYRVRYRLPGGLVISAQCTMVAARAGRSLTYVWEGGGMRMAVGQSFAIQGEGTRTRVIADLAAERRLAPVATLVARLMGRGLDAELERALATLGELAAARAVVRRSPQGGERRSPGATPAVSVLRRAPGAGPTAPAGGSGAGPGAPSRRGGTAARAAAGGTARATGTGSRRPGGGPPAPAVGRGRRRRLPLDPLEDPGGAAGGAVDHEQDAAGRHTADVRAAGTGSEGAEP